MRKNYFVKLVKYLKSVYRIDEGLKSLTDDRINPTYQTSHVVSLVLFGFLLRVRSFNELNNLIKGQLMALNSLVAIKRVLKSV